MLGVGVAVNPDLTPPRSSVDRVLNELVESNVYGEAILVVMVFLALFMASGIAFHVLTEVWPTRLIHPIAHLTLIFVPKMTATPIFSFEYDIAPSI